MRFFLHLIGLCIFAHFLSIFFAVQWAWGGLLIYGLIFPHRRIHAFLIGFLSIFIVWTVYAYIIDAYNAHILASRIGELLGGIPWVFLPLITGIIGGIGGGLSIWAGNSIRKLYVGR